jgi:uncharacterized membrane protein
MLPHDDKPWAKTVARIVICGTIVILVVLAFILKAYNTLRIPEVVGLILLLLTIVPPNLAIIYPWLLPANQSHNHGAGSKSATR